MNEFLLKVSRDHFLPFETTHMWSVNLAVKHQSYYHHCQPKRRPVMRLMVFRMSRHGGAVRILSYELLGFKNLLSFASHKSRVNRWLDPKVCSIPRWKKIDCCCPTLCKGYSSCGTKKGLWRDKPVNTSFWNLHLGFWRPFQSHAGSSPSSWVLASLSITCWFQRLTERIPMDYRNDCKGNRRLLIIRQWISSISYFLKLLHQIKLSVILVEVHYYLIFYF